MNKVQIFPSVLAADFTRLGEEINAVETVKADGLHLDIMDGHFVPNITFGPPVVESIRRTTKLFLSAHLMLDDPGMFIKPFRQAGADAITIHPEIKDDWIALIEKIHDLGIEAGIAINPETPVETIEAAKDKIDRILMMSVHPGFGGQNFMMETVDKIVNLERNIRSWNKKPLLEVDGGINEKTIPAVVKAGINVLIMGSAIFRKDDAGAALVKLRKQANDIYEEASGKRNL